jgi:hypothetical protein
VFRKFIYELLFFMVWFWTWESGSHFLTTYELWPWAEAPAAAATPYSAETSRAAPPTSVSTTSVENAQRPT